MSQTPRLVNFTCNGAPIQFDSAKVRYTACSTMRMGFSSKATNMGRSGGSGLILKRGLLLVFITAASFAVSYNLMLVVIHTYKELNSIRSTQSAREYTSEASSNLPADAPGAEPTDQR
eukprot:7203241-Pyramimonas_sp.AAC.1